MNIFLWAFFCVSLYVIDSIAVCKRYFTYSWLIVIVFNVVFNSISVISRPPVHLSMLSWSSFFKPVLRTTFCQSQWLLSHITIVETTDCSKRGMNPVAMVIINPRKEYWPCQGSNQRPLNQTGRVSCRGLMIVIASGCIPLSSLKIVQTM